MYPQQNIDTENIQQVLKSDWKNKNVEDINKYIAWLLETPAITTYRVDPEKAGLIKNVIEIYLKKVQSQYNRKDTPKVHLLFPDIIAINQWPEEQIPASCTNTQEVIVDAACGAAILRGSHLFAPGVMGLSADARLDDDVNIYADISGNCKKGLKIKYENGSKIFVGRGRLKMLRSEIFGENLDPKGIAVETLMPVSRIPVIDRNIFPLGCYLLQNLPSIICSKVLNPEPGEHVLDMCAAPGNKTSHLAKLMNNKGIVIALDKSSNKINNIQSICQELAITCVHPFVFDSTKSVKECNTLKTCNVGNLTDGPPFLPESFDRILLDVPCSALGQRPLLKNKMTVKMLQSYVPLQRKLFHAGVRLLKNHGRLVYSTCTITVCECEGMVRWALDTFPQLKLIAAEPLVGGPGMPHSGLDDQERLMVQRFGPETSELRIMDPIYNNTVGFFIASFEKCNQQ